MTGADEVDAYLAGVPADARDALQELRAFIKTLVPEATERMSYGIPVLFFHGMLVGIGVHKKGCSLYVMRPTMVASLKAELDGFQSSGGTIHFAPERPMPKTLIEKIVALRVADNLGN